MARVYVSSTFADLRRERQAVMDWLVTAGHQPVHSYRPNSETVRDSCLDDVDTCDLYVLIAGHRYGFRPADANPEGLSITHLEFRRAGQSGIPRIALVRTSMSEVSTSDIGDLQKLALVLAFRDEIAREVRTAEFGDTEGLIQGLSTGVLAELAKQSADAMGAGRALRLALPPTLLVGRENLLVDLDTLLAGSAGPRVVALYGLGGAGKTSVALAYAHRHLAEAGIAWQFPAQDAAVLAAAFSELAAQLGAREGGDPVAVVHTILATYPAGWLLVFDNAPDWISVERFLPPAGNGRVLITSRNALWPQGQGVEVPVLDLEAAAGFLAARTADADHQAAAALAEAVGGLPLALEQAAAYIQAAGDSLGGYLTLFQERRADLLARGEPIGYGGTVATAWTLAFTQVEQANPRAVGLLRLLAFYAPDAIPLSLLLQPRPGLIEELAPGAEALESLLEDDLAAKDAVAELRRYSLVTPGRDGSVSVHRLVQALTVDYMTEEVADAWGDAAAELIDEAIPRKPQDPQTWAECAALLPHAQAALPAEHSGLASLVHYLRASGDYSAARDLQQRVFEARQQRYGPEDRDTLIAQGGLAVTTASAGDLKEAQRLLTSLLPVIERVFGREHPEPLQTRANLAYVTGAAGNPAEARDQYAVLVPIREKVSGPEHHYTLTAKGNLARLIGEAGDQAGARDQLAELVPSFKRALGPEHPDTLTAEALLATYTGEAGDAAGARDQYAALLPVRERISGPEHPDTLTARDNLAHWTGKAGEGHESGMG